jgi:cytochrome c biogenesis protein CcmG/thiol:disulfide interchange protein DsbE
MRRTVLWIALSVGVVGALLVAVLATREPAEARFSDSPLLGKPAPAATGRALDGSTMRLADLRGRYVVLNFFATWCVPCQREHPELSRFQNRHAQTGDATVLAVIFDDDVPSVRSFFEREGGDWPVLDDPGGKIALDFGVRGPPESFLIDPDGFVVSKIVGEVRADALESLVARAKRGAS